MKQFFGFGKSRKKVSARASDPSFSARSSVDGLADRKRRNSDPPRPSLTQRPPRTSLEVRRGLDDDVGTTAYSTNSVPARRSVMEIEWTGVAMHVPMSGEPMDIDAVALPTTLVKIPGTPGSLRLPEGSGTLLTVRTPRGSIGNISADHINAFRAPPLSPKPNHKPPRTPETQSDNSVGNQVDDGDLPDDLQPEPGWKRVAHNVFRPPRVLHEWIYDLREVEVKAGWTELFYDLLFVVTCIVLGDSLKEHLTWTGLGITLFYFTAFYMSWSIANFYFARFVYTDIVHQELIFFHMVGVLLMVVNVTMEDTQSKRLGLLVGFIVSRLPIIVMHALVCWYIHRAWRGSALIAFSSTLAIGLWIGALFVPLGVALGLATTGLVLEAAAMFAPHVHLKPHGGYLSERNGLFTMIVLGEGVISLVLPGMEREDVSWEHYIVIVIIGFWLLFNLQLSIFDTLPKESHLDKLQESFVRVRAVTAIYAMLAFTLLCTGVGLKAAATNLDYKLKTQYRALLGGSVAACLLLLQVLRALYSPGYDTVQAYLADGTRVVAFVLRLGLPVTILVVTFTTALQSREFVIVVWALTGLYVVVDTWAHERHTTELRAVLVTKSITWDGLGYRFADCPDLDSFFAWGAVDVKLWMKNDLQLSDEALTRVEEFDISGEKLLQASAAEVIVVFHPSDGARLVVELARIVQGAHTLTRSESRNSVGVV